MCLCIGEKLMHEAQRVSEISRVDDGNRNRMCTLHKGCMSGSPTQVVRRYRRKGDSKLQSEIGHTRMLIGHAALKD